MKQFLRILVYCTYPFLALSALMLAGMIFGAAFVAPLTVENHTGQALLITPVGTIGDGYKAALPTLMFAMPALPALRAGRYRLGPGESVTILYDMDDIHFSEIVIEDNRGRILQFVADPEPTKNQYHGPLKKGYILEDVDTLPMASPAVIRASAAAPRRAYCAAFLLLLLIAPWPANWALNSLLSRYDRRM